MKTVQYAAIVILFVIPYVYAMDLDIVCIKPKRFKTLPLELQSKIVENIIDLTVHEHEKTKECIDQKKWKKFNVSELLLGVKCAQGFQSLQKTCQKEIGCKKIAPQDLFTLSSRQQDALIRIANRSRWTIMLEGNSSLDDYKIIKSIENKEITKGMELFFLRKQSHKYLHYAETISLCGLLIGGICLSVVISGAIKEWSLFAAIVVFGACCSVPSYSMFMVTQLFMHSKCKQMRSIKRLTL